MIRNGMDLLLGKLGKGGPPIADMESRKVRQHGVSHGLSEAGYDIRIKQEIRFSGCSANRQPVVTYIDDEIEEMKWGRFVLASAIEEFHMPTDLVGVVHDKSTWARFGLSVFNTVIEPGWKGFLTLELVYHGQQDLTIPAGAGIAQVLFHEITRPIAYDGKYQDQADEPVSSIMDKNDDQ